MWPRKKLVALSILHGIIEDPNKVRNVNLVSDAVNFTDSHSFTIEDGDVLGSRFMDSIVVTRI